MKADDLRSLERTERTHGEHGSVGCPSSDRRRCEDSSPSFLTSIAVADVIRHPRLRWFGHLDT